MISILNINGVNFLHILLHHFLKHISNRLRQTQVKEIKLLSKRSVHPLRDSSLAHADQNQREEENIFQFQQKLKQEIVLQVGHLHHAAYAMLKIQDQRDQEAPQLMNQVSNINWVLNWKLLKHKSSFWLQNQAWDYFASFLKGKWEREAYCFG